MVQLCQCVKIPEKLLLGLIDTDYYSDVDIFNRLVDLLYWKGSRNSEVDFLITTKNDEVIPVAFLI